MTDFAEVEALLLEKIAAETDPTNLSDLTKSLKTVTEAHDLVTPDPIPDPEPTGVRGFFHRHTGDLIKVGGTLSTVFLIATLENKDLIFRSKASKLI